MIVLAVGACLILNSLSSPANTALADGPSGRLEMVGHLGGMPNALAVRNGLLYAAIGPELAVFDVSGAPQLRRVGYLVFPDMVQDVALAPSDGYVCVAVGQAGFALVDVTQPEAPRLVAPAGTPGYAQAVDVAGGYAYVAADYSLRILDISHPPDVFEVSALETPGLVRSVAISGHNAYVGQLVSTGDISNAGLLIVDISDPAKPLPMGSLDIPEYAAAVGVAVAPSGSYAYVAAGMGGLRVVDISDPTAPAEVTTWKPAQGYPNPWHVEITDDLAFVADGTAGLFVLDVSDPTAPVQVAAYGDAGRVVDVVVAGATAYVAASHSLQVLDFSDPTALSLLADQPVPANPDRLAIGDGCVYAAGGHNVWVVNVSDLAAPTAVGSMVFDRQVQGIALTEQANTGYLLVTSGDCDGGPCTGALSVVDMTDPAQPLSVGSYRPETGYAVGVAVAADLAYLAARDAGLWVLNVADPGQPRHVGGVVTGGFAMDIAVQGDTAYLADRGGGLRIIDVSEPLLPTEAGAYGPPDEAWSVAVADGMAYVGVRTFGLRTVDTSLPTAPREVGFFETWPGLSVEDIAVADDTVLAAAGYDGLRMVDVSDPSTPLDVGGYDTPGGASAVAVLGDKVYLADGLGGLFILRRQR